MDPLTQALLIIGVIVVLIGFSAWQIISNERQMKARNSARIDKEWGKMPTREYSEEQLASIQRAYHKRMEGGLRTRDRYSIDDITWNDLDMNQIFILLNNTQSSAGDEAVYQALRMPCFDKEELMKREQLITYFQSHPKERKRMQMLFSKIGKMRKYSMTDYIDIFMKQHAESNLTHYIPLIFMLIAIAIIPFSLGGVLALVLIVIYNIVNYYRTKAKVEPYFVCVSYVVSLVKQSLEVCKEFRDVKELMEYLKELETAANSLKGVVSKAAILNTGGSVSDNPMNVVVEYLKMMTHVDLIQFNRILNQVQMSTTQIQQMMDVLGKIELTIAIASFREMMPLYKLPEFYEDETRMELDVEDLYHPLIKEPVANSIHARKPVLLTGSNASGKSTFLKTVAINAILAQSIHTVCATSYRSGFFRVYSSMALRDNLESEESYYMVEIRSLKRIVEAAKEERIGSAKYPVLCFVDEVLRGTNTVERIAASSQILKTLAKEGCLSFAATHDIELTHMMEQYYDNYHFREEISGNDIFFPYVLFEGRSQTRNAIKLLEMMGYDHDITIEAEELAQNFLQTGAWKNA